MNFLDETGLARLWEHIISKLGRKVDKVDGKGLSANDFTDEYKEKLDALEGTGAIDVTLTHENEAADAKVTGDFISLLTQGSMRKLGPTDEIITNDSVYISIFYSDWTAEDKNLFMIEGKQYII